MKSKHNLLISLIGILLMCVHLQCKKFEEDDEWIHFRTVKKRIEGLKELTMHQLGPTDLLPYWHSRFGDFYLDLTLFPYNPNNKGDGYKVRVYHKASDSLICEGQWGLGGGFSIHFDCLDSDTSTSYPNKIHGIYSRIVKLSNSELWLRWYPSWNYILKMMVTEEIRLIEYKKN
jgi:hypothetical protein